MKDLFIQFISTICSIAAVIGIKILDLPALVTAILVAIAVFFCVYAIAGGFSKRKATEKSCA